LVSLTETAAAARRRNLLSGLLFAALILAVYSDPLFFRRNFTGRDLVVYNLPMEKKVHEAYARGQLPVWTPEISGGRSFPPFLFPWRCGSFPSSTGSPPASE
jgi:hypothetical protein